MSRALSLPLVAAVLGLSGVALLLPAAPAAGQEICSDCHEEAVAPESVHLDLGCSGCHSDLDDFPHPDDRLAGDAICAQCHEASEEMESGLHAGLLDCTSCHGAPHEVLPAAASASPVSARRQPETCGECHDSELIDAFRGSVHGDALLGAGLEVAPTCSSCHGAHAVGGETSTVSFELQPETCGSCHAYLLEDWLTGAHGRLWEQVVDGDAAADDRGAAMAGPPVCSTCHSSHDVSLGAGEARLGTVESCGDCHGDRFASYRDSFHGQATSLGFRSAATCADCHTPHVNLAADDPASSVHPDHLAATCGRCHGDVPAAFLTFAPHSEPSEREHSHPAVYWTWWGMTGLLLFVFAFFGLHTLLWLQRATVGWLRGELAAAHDGDGPWVRRFSRFHRGTHLVIIVSFLTLAATGLPLKFHQTAWAQALASVPWGFEIAHLLHRLAAVVTFGYAAAHVGYLFRRVVVDRQGGILWGWRSMVPRFADLRELAANLRYFLYLGPRPQHDRWTYWEKFDYFAVFWGVPVIGLSGLMLWFPGVFTAFLPGWALNVAWVVHSDEALLATGFIFIFHFFHTHLRPEAFPMDPVMFVGAMPLARFRDERPREYERLVEQGRLDERLVPAPSRRQLVRARIFGFLAVAVGLALAVGIVYGVLFVR